MSRFLHSIRFRMTLWYGGVLALALAVFAISVYIFVVRTLETSIDEALNSYGQQAAASRVHANGRVLRQAPIAAILVMDEYGDKKRVAKNGAPATDFHPLRIAMRSGRESCGTVPSQYSSAARGQHPPLRFCTKLLYQNGKPIGGVEVVQSLGGVNNALDRLRLALLLGIPFALVLAGAGGWILAGRALEPVDRISQMARSITATDLSRRINLPRQDELGRLAGTFDDMIDRLERAFQEQRQLTADVSHELRSPLTVLEAQTSLSLRRGRTAEEYRHVLGSVQEEVERLSDMVKQLLILARADAGEELIQLEPLSLASIVDPVVTGMQPLAEERGIALKARADPGAWVQGDSARLRQLLVNLLDNALSHTSKGGRVEVSAGTDAGHPFLRVSDTGEGIEAGDLPHVFQRFYRGDRARQRGAGNSGLGLAIVKWIVEAHGGDIVVDSRPGKGATFTVKLRPIAAAA